METANFVCMKWKDAYSADYVNKLYSMIQRNIKRPFRLICYTENKEGIIPEVEVYDLPPFNFPEEWQWRAYRKKSLTRAVLHPFKEGERFLFLDLDVVITGSLDEMFDYETDKDFIICYNWTRGKGKIGNSSVTMMRVGALNHVIEDLEKDPVKYVNQYKTASQEYMSAKVIEKYGKLTFWPDEWCRSFQIHCMQWRFMRLIKAPSLPPTDCKVLVFHGAVNPPDAINGHWPGKVQFYKRFYKTIKPTPWIKDFWK